MDNITSDKNKNIEGGKAFAEGAYGCVFRPALKCKTEKNRRDGVSKLMLVDKAYNEFNEINKFVKVLSQIPNYRSLFMFPYNVCKVDSLDKKIDLTSFNKNIFLIGNIVLFAYGFYAFINLYKNYDKRELIHSNLKTIYLQIFYGLFIVIFFNLFIT